MKLEKHSTADTPEVILNPEKGVFLIGGRSMPEDAGKFYRPIINWLNNYLKQPNDSTVFHVELEYFNSSSIKQLLTVMQKLEQLSKTGKMLLCEQSPLWVRMMLNASIKAYNSLVSCRKISGISASCSSSPYLSFSCMKKAPGSSSRVRTRTRVYPWIS